MNTRIRLNFLLRMKILDCYSILSMKYFFFLNLSVRYTQPRSILSKLGYLILPAKFLFIFITRLSRYLFNSIRIIPNFILVQFHFQQNRVPFEEYKPKKSSPNNYLNNNRDEQSPFRTPFFVHVCWCSRFLFHSIPGKTSSLCIYIYIYTCVAKKRRSEEKRESASTMRQVECATCPQYGTRASGKSPHYPPGPFSSPPRGLGRKKFGSINPFPSLHRVK